MKKLNDVNNISKEKEKIVLSEEDKKIAEKKLKKLIILCIVLVSLVVAYFVLHFYNTRNTALNDGKQIINQESTN